MSTPSLAFNWLEALQKKTIKNISHLDFLSKYAGFRTNIDQCVLILQGLRFTTREVFLIRVHGALYEPFAGPHYVQIGDNAPFWVHSLTAFRREFFGLTDKLSFERSVFVGLSDGEVVRLKIIRPYIFIPHEIVIPDGAVLKIMKSPTTFFYINNRIMLKHKEEVASKKAEAIAQRAAVRERVRKHLVGTVQQLFCSYTRDTHIDVASAVQWFRTDMKYAMDTCELLYPHLSRVRPERDVHDALNDITGIVRPHVVRAATAEDLSVLHRHMSSVDTSITDALRSVRGAERVETPAISAEEVERNVRSMLLMEGYDEDVDAADDGDDE
jgi:hypothetical protein